MYICHANGEIYINEIIIIIMCIVKPCFSYAYYVLFCNWKLAFLCCQNHQHSRIGILNRLCFAVFCVTLLGHHYVVDLSAYLVFVDPRNQLSKSKKISVISSMSSLSTIHKEISHLRFTWPIFVCEYFVACNNSCFNFVWDVARKLVFCQACQLEFTSVCYAIAYYVVSGFAHVDTFIQFRPEDQSWFGNIVSLRRIVIVGISDSSRSPDDVGLCLFCIFLNVAFLLILFFAFLCGERILAECSSKWVFLRVVFHEIKCVLDSREHFMLFFNSCVQSIDWASCRFFITFYYIHYGFVDWLLNDNGLPSGSSNV